MSINLLTDIFRSKRALKIPPEIEQRFKEEELCRRCGLCCYGSVRYKGRLVIIKELPCRYLRLMLREKLPARFIKAGISLLPGASGWRERQLRQGCFRMIALMFRELKAIRERWFWWVRKRKSFIAG